jgi:hypothetical protein
VAARNRPTLPPPLTLRRKVLSIAAQPERSHDSCLVVYVATRNGSIFRCVWRAGAKPADVDVQLIGNLPAVRAIALPPAVTGTGRGGHAGNVEIFATSLMQPTAVFGSPSTDAAPFAANHRTVAPTDTFPRLLAQRATTLCEVEALQSGTTSSSGGGVLPLALFRALFLPHGERRRRRGGGDSGSGGGVGFTRVILQVS